MAAQQPLVTADSSRQWRILGVVLLAAGGLFAYAKFHEYQRITVEERSQLAKHAEVVEKNVVPQLLLANRVIEGIIRDLPVWRAQNDGFKLASQQLGISNDTLIGIRPILLIGADGTVIASSNPTLVGMNFLHREYFQTALQNPDPQILHVSPPFKTVLDTFVISLFRTLTGPQGEFAGIVIVSVVPEYFSVLIDSVRYAPDVMSFIAHGDGKLFLTAPFSAEHQGKNLAKHGSLFMQHRESGQLATVLAGTTDTTGDEHIIAQRSIQLDTPRLDKPLVVGVSRQTEVIYAAWRDELYKESLLLGLLAILSALALLLHQKRLLAQSVERKAANQALLASENRFRSFIENINDVLFVLTPHGVFSYVSPQWHEAFGYELSETVGQSFVPFVHPDDVPACMEFLQRALSTAEKQSGVEYRVRCKDGSYRWYTANASLIIDPVDNVPTLVGIGRDITERKETENGLILARQIFDMAGEAIFVSDLAGKLLEVNAEACRLAKYSREEMLRLHNVDIVVADEAPRIAGELAQCDDGHVVENRWLLRCSDGSTVPLDLVVQRLPGDRYLAIGRDLTEREKTLKQLAAARDIAEAASLAKTRFLAAASHDLRQPLQSLNLFIDALSRTSRSEEQVRINDYLSQSAHSLSVMLNALLDVSKLDSGSIRPHFKALQVGALFDALDSQYAPLAMARSLQFKFHFPLGPLAVFTDTQLIMALLGNLIGNAIKYTEHGGVLISIRRRNNRALFQVWDTGIGIAPEHQEIIFEEFFQLGNPERDNKKGLGLGLSIVRRLACLLDTEVACRSRPGKGSVFAFSLPLADKHQQEASSPDGSLLSGNAVQTGRLAGRHIVVIEDNVLVAEATQLSLQSCGLSVTRYDTAEDALANPDIGAADFYISDFRLPGLNGLQLLDTIQQRSAKPIKALLLTGDASQGKSDPRQNTRWKVLVKPVELPRLIAAIESLDALP